MSDHPESSTASCILRNDDLLSLALRGGASLDLEEIARLNREMSPANVTSSSVASSSTVVSSSHEESTITKPTSACTSQAANTHNDKGKRRYKSGYASSLSAAYGSASEAEMVRGALRRDNLRALGGWMSVSSQPLKDPAKAKSRQKTSRKIKPKKEVVVHNQNHRGYGTLDDRTDPVVTDGPLVNVGPMVINNGSHSGAGSRYLRHRTFTQDDEAVRQAEQGQAHTETSQDMRLKPLSPARVYALAGLTGLIGLTLAVAAYCAYLTGKTRMPCTKGIVFVATTALALLTVLAMLIARRALSEALLAGLLELVFGFALLVELDDFM